MALDYFHSLEHVYLNLLPQNICIDSQGYIKLIDFRPTRHFHSEITFDDVSEYQHKITVALRCLKNSEIDSKTYNS